MNENRTSFFNSYKLDKTDIKSTLLSRSLLWMGLGLAIIVLVAWISSTNNVFLELAIKFSVGTNWIIMWILNTLLIFGLFFTLNNKNTPLIVPIILYSIFALFEGFFVTTILVFTGTNEIMKDLLLFMLIPSFSFGLMGVLAYFNVIDFSKLIPFALISTIALFIMGILLFFLSSSFLENMYLILAAIVFNIWIGFDIQMIARTQEINPYMDKKELNRLSFLFGIKLFIDFVNLLIIVIRFFGGRN